MLLHQFFYDDDISYDATTPFQIIFHFSATVAHTTPWLYAFFIYDFFFNEIRDEFK